MWLAPKILPIMSVVALCLIVRTTLKGTPLSFKVVHVEIFITWVVVNQTRLDIALRVSE